MKKSDSAYVAQILENIATIRKYVGAYDFDAFAADDRTQHAVMMQIQQIGEMAKRVSAETREAVDVPWKNITGFRDVIAHDYYDIALSLAWNTVRDDLPALEAPLASYLTTHPIPSNL